MSHWEITKSLDNGIAFVKMLLNEEPNDNKRDYRTCETTGINTQLRTKQRQQTKPPKGGRGQDIFQRHSSVTKGAPRPAGPRLF